MIHRLVEHFVGRQTDRIPVALALHIAIDLQYSSRPGENVFGPLAGSGSTLIACAQTVRRCFMMEIGAFHVESRRDRSMATIRTRLLLLCLVLVDLGGSASAAEEPVLELAVALKVGKPVLVVSSRTTVSRPWLQSAARPRRADNQAPTLSDGTGH